MKVLVGAATLFLIQLVGSTAFCQFDFHLPSSVSFSVSADSSKTRTTSISGNANVYKNNFLNFAVESTKILIDENDTYKVNNFFAGYSSDSLNFFQFRFDYNRVSSEGKIKSEQARAYSILNFEKLSAGLVLGAASAQFLTIPTNFNNEDTKTFSGSHFGFLVDVFLSSNWAVSLNATKYGYDQDLSIFDNELVTFFVPVQSLNVITSFIKYEATLGVSYTLKRFGVNYRINTIKGASDDVKGLSNSLGFNFVANRDWNFFIEFANSQALDDELSDGALRSFSIGTSYVF